MHKLRMKKIFWCSSCACSRDCVSLDITDFLNVLYLVHTQRGVGGERGEWGICKRFGKRTRVINHHWFEMSIEWVGRFNTLLCFADVWFGIGGVVQLVVVVFDSFLWNTGGFIVIGIYFNKQEKTVLMTLHVLDRHIKAVICVLRWSVYFWLVICHMCTKEFYYLLQLVKIIIYKLLNLCIIRIIQIQNKINMLLCTHSLLSVFLL